MLIFPGVPADQIVTPTQTQNNGNRKKRSISNSPTYSDNFDENASPTVVNDTGIEPDPNKATWPTPSGITENEAKELCEKNITLSRFYTEKCISILDPLKVNQSIDACIKDIKVFQNLLNIDLYTLANLVTSLL